MGVSRELKDTLAAIASGEHEVEMVKTSDPDKIVGRIDTGNGKVARIVYSIETDEERAEHEGKKPEKKLEWTGWR